MKVFKQIHPVPKLQIQLEIQLLKICIQLQLTTNTNVSELKSVVCAQQITALPM